MRHEFLRTALLRVLAAVMLVFGALKGEATAQAQQIPFGEASLGAITEEDVLVLLRNTLVGLDQANKTGDYSVFRALASPEFRQRSLENIAGLFVNLRDNEIDLTYAALIEPNYILPAEVMSDGMLRVAGFFPSFPQQVHFDLLFKAGSERWEVYGIYVGVRGTAPKPLQPDKP